jgi:hypothetical protein
MPLPFDEPGFRQYGKRPGHRPDATTHFLSDGIYPGDALVSAALHHEQKSINCEGSWWRAFQKLESVTRYQGIATTLARRIAIRLLDFAKRLFFREGGRAPTGRSQDQDLGFLARSIVVAQQACIAE